MGVCMCTGQCKIPGVGCPSRSIPTDALIFSDYNSLRHYIERIEALEKRIQLLEKGQLTKPCDNCKGSGIVGNY